MAKLSVIVPMYNTEKYLKKCLTSIADQSSDIEVILVDDGSTDNTVAICKEFIARDNRFKLISIPNQGVAFARYVGIQNAQGQYLTFVDSDDYIDEAMYDDFIWFMDHNEDVSLCMCGIVRVCEDGSEKPFKQYFPDKMMYPEEVVEEMLDGKYISWGVWDKIYRHELFSEYKVVENLNYAEDLDLNWHILKKANKIWYSSKKKYYYCERLGSAVTRENVLASSRGKIYYALLKDFWVNKQHVKELLCKRYLVNMKRVFLRLFIEYERDAQRAIEELQEEIREVMRLSGTDVQCYSDIVKIMLSNYIECEKYYINYIDNIKKMIRTISISELPIYIYGTGMVSTYFSLIMEKCGRNCEAYLVSNNVPDGMLFRGKRILNVNSILEIKDVIIFLAMKVDNQREVRKMLCGKKFNEKNIYYTDLDVML